jgi:uncharacterized protein (DUF1501 family)
MRIFHPNGHLPHLSRRSALVGAGALFSWSYLPKFAQAAQGRDPRFITIILRGALDGLSAVAPLGDPSYASLHGAIALSRDGANAALPLDSFFGLNPAMKHFAKLYQAKQAAIVHAVATPYRERSHFDGQDVLESGMPDKGLVSSGWMNRMLQALPKGDKVNPQRSGLAVGSVTPLIMRGPAPVTGWVPSGMASASDDVAQRLLDLYAQRDPVLGQALAQGLGIEKIVARDMGDLKPGGGGVPMMRQVAQGAAKLLAADDGPRLGALAFDGWDTHANEGGATGRLAQLLGGLDDAIEEFEKELGPKWAQTVIVVVTEFGRTARINGTIGTDHGTGTVAFLAGGALKGGRVIADWPGLKEEQLYEKRDLKPTTDLRAVLKGIMVEHLGLSANVLGDKVFPNSAALAPLTGLIS